MNTYYDSVFLDRAKAMLTHDWGAQLRNIPANSGKTIIFNRFAPLALATTPLTEGVTNPTPVDMSTAQITATIAPYGNYTQITDLFSLTSLDANLKEHSEVHGQNAGETIDALYRNEMAAGATVQLANNRGSLAAIVAGDNMTGAEIRKSVRTLKTNKAMRFDSGLFRGIVQPFTSYDLFGNQEWLNSTIYVDPTPLKEGVVGKLHGVEFKETNQGYTEASTVTVYSNFIFGQNAYGGVSLANQPGWKMYVKPASSGGTSNPLEIFSTIGWKMFFVAKTLNPNWIINVKTAASA